MNRSKKPWAKALILSFAVILTCLLYLSLSHADPLTASEDTVYFEPAPGSRISPDGDTFYVDLGGDIKVNVNLKNVETVSSFDFLLKDTCYDGDIYVDTAKNNYLLCYEGNRVEYWPAHAVSFISYPPEFLLGGVAGLADPLPTGDGPLATLTFTALNTGCICLDTFWTPAAPGLTLCDAAGVGYIPGFIPRDFHVKICPYVPGDLNWDEIVDLLDLPLLIYYLFKGWEAPCPLKAADVNCDQVVGLIDVVYLINYIFRSGPAPQTCEY